MTHAWTLYLDGRPECPLTETFEAADLGTALAALVGDSINDLAGLEEYADGDYTLTIEACRDIRWCDGSPATDLPPHEDECRCGGPHEDGDMLAIGNVWSRRVLVGIRILDGEVAAVTVPDCGACPRCDGRLRLEPLADGSGLRGERCDGCGARWAFDPPRVIEGVSLG